MRRRRHRPRTRRPSRVGTRPGRWRDDLGVTLVPRNRPSSQASPPLPATTQIVDPDRSPGPAAVDPAATISRPASRSTGSCERAGFERPTMAGRCPSTASGEHLVGRVAQLHAQAQAPADLGGDVHVEPRPCPPGAVTWGRSGRTAIRMTPRAWTSASRVGGSAPGSQRPGPDEHHPEHRQDQTGCHSRCAKSGEGGQGALDRGALGPTHGDPPASGEPRTPVRPGTLAKRCSIPSSLIVQPRRFRAESSAESGHRLGRMTACGARVDPHDRADLVE